VRELAGTLLYLVLGIALTAFGGLVCVGSFGESWRMKSRYGDPDFLAAWFAFAGVFLVGVFLVVLGVRDVRRRRRLRGTEFTSKQRRWAEAEDEVLRTFADAETARRIGKAAESVCEQENELESQKAIRDTDSSTR